MEKTQSTLYVGARATSNVQLRLAFLLRILFHRVFLHTRIIVLEMPHGEAARAWLAHVSANKVRARVAGIADIPRFAPFRKFEGGGGDPRERMKAGHLGFIGEDNGIITGYVWVAFGEHYIGEIERKIRMGPGSAYAYNGYTDIRYRGRGILPVLLMTASEYLSQNGIREIYTVVLQHNDPPLRSHQKIKSRKMGTVTFLRLFGLRRYKLKGETPADLHKLMEIFSI